MELLEGLSNFLPSAAYMQCYTRAFSKHLEMHISLENTYKSYLFFRIGKSLPIMKVSFPFAEEETKSNSSLEDDLHLTIKWMIFA